MPNYIVTVLKKNNRKMRYVIGLENASVEEASKLLLVDKNSIISVERVPQECYSNTNSYNVKHDENYVLIKTRNLKMDN